MLLPICSSSSNWNGIQGTGVGALLLMELKSVRFFGGFLFLLFCFFGNFKEHGSFKWLNQLPLYLT